MENRVNNISLRDLSTNVEPCISLGEGSFGKCFSKIYKRMGIPVVEKQIIDGNIYEIIKEAQIMQALVHPNIPTILRVQIEEPPFSIIMEYLGEANTSFTVHSLLQNTNSLEKKDWVKISYNVADALNHIHKKGFLHCDLKTNNVVVYKKEGFLIDFGKACPVTSPRAKKYKFSYPHIAPEVLKGSACSKHSDIYSLGTVLKKISLSQNILCITEVGCKCLNDSPKQQPTLMGILASLASQNEFLLK